MMMIMVIMMVMMIMIMMMLLIMMLMMLTLSFEESSHRWQQSYNDHVYDTENISGKCLSGKLGFQRSGLWTGSS